MSDMEQTERRLRVAVPSKGRLRERAEELLRRAGLRFNQETRALIAHCAGMEVDLVFARTDDIPILVAENAVDLGITGQDLIAERGVVVDERLRLSFGHCRLALIVQEGSGVTDPRTLSGKRIATSFPKLTSAYFAQLGVSVRVVELNGSIEAMISLGVADALVDLVATGGTLRENRLRALDILGHYEAVLIANQGGGYTAVANRLVRRIEGVVIASEYAIVEYNVRRDSLPEAEKITPGYESPTVQSLEDPEWCAVKVMVKRGEVMEIMDRLEAMGATAIFETQIENCRM